MSLTRTLLRLVTVQALVGKTVAGDKVFDSSIDPLDQKVAAEAAPMIVVYTDDDKSQPAGLADFFQGGSVDLVMETVVAGRITVTYDDDGAGGPAEAQQVIVSQTDARMEVALDLIEGQIVRALVAADDPWSRLWKRIAIRATKRESRRGASPEQSSRFAARQLVLTLGIIVDPDPGAPLPSGSIWRDALDQIATVPGMADVAGLLRSDIEGEPLNEWRRAAARLGVGLETISALGLGPVGADDPVPLTDVDAVEGLTP